MTANQPVTPDDIREVVRVARRGAISRTAALHHALAVARHCGPRQVSSAAVRRIFVEEWPASHGSAHAAATAGHSAPKDAPQ
jgi:hypothetical protein